MDTSRLKRRLETLRRQSGAAPAGRGVSAESANAVNASSAESANAPDTATGESADAAATVSGESANAPGTASTESANAADAPALAMAPAMSRDRSGRADDVPAAVTARVGVSGKSTHAPRTAPATERNAVVAGLAERIRRLEGSTRTRPVRRRSTRADAARLAELVGGQLLSPGTIVTERCLPLTGRHGAFGLPRVGEPVHGLPEGEVDPRGVVFLDAETSGLSGGTGTVVFLLGLGRLQAETLVVRQFLLTAFAGEADLLTAAGDWVAGAQAMVTFNGKSFDLPLVAARCRLAGVAERFSALRQVDLLHSTRRAFATRWDDCRLGTAERRLLRFERENDLPGSLAPQSWFAFVRRGDARRLPLVTEHNYWDIVSLAALLPALADVHTQPGAWEADILAVARAHRRASNDTRAFAMLREHRSMLGADGLLELARFHRRAKEWDHAGAIWESLAGQGHAEATECLAKYHEHVRRDCATALLHAERLPGGGHHDHRRARLHRKLAAPTPR